MTKVFASKYKAFSSKMPAYNSLVSSTVIFQFKTEKKVFHILPEDT